MKVRRAIIGFIVRLAIATAISAFVFYLWITPFDRQPFPKSVTMALIRVLDFPVALAGSFLPIRGIYVLFDSFDNGCDFCTPAQHFWRQMRIAIPTYLFLLYLATLVRYVVRRVRHRVTQSPVTR